MNLKRRARKKLMPQAIPPPIALAPKVWDQEAEAFRHQRSLGETLDERIQRLMPGLSWKRTIL